MFVDDEGEIEPILAEAGSIVVLFKAPTPSPHLQLALQSFANRNRLPVYLTTYPLATTQLQFEPNAPVEEVTTLCCKHFTKINAIIVDLDNTLVLNTGRSPFDWAKMHTDVLNPAVADLILREASNGVEILVVTARTIEVHDQTMDWLAGHGIPVSKIYMRPLGTEDVPDFELKKKIFQESIAPYYRVLYALEDRASVVKMWRSLGLTCFQVSEGDF